MKANRNIVLAYLRKLEKKNGGHYGTDLTILAKELSSEVSDAAAIRCPCGACF